MNNIVEAVAGRITEKTKIANLYRRNACIKHGIPYDEDAEIPTVNVEHKHVHEHGGLEEERAVVAGLNESVKAETKAVEGLTEAIEIGKDEEDRDPRKEEFREKPILLSSFPDWLKKGLTAAALLGGGAGGMAVTNYVTSDPPAAEEKDGSLLQYLEDQGEHLPGGFEQ